MCSRTILLCTFFKDTSAAHFRIFSNSSGIFVRCLSYENFDFANSRSTGLSSVMSDISCKRVLVSCTICQMAWPFSAKTLYISGGNEVHNKHYIVCTPTSNKWEHKTNRCSYSYAFAGLNFIMRCISKSFYYTSNRPNFLSKRWGYTKGLISLQWNALQLSGKSFSFTIGSYCTPWPSAAL